MANNAEVAAALAPENDWRTAYPFVEVAARAILDTTGLSSWTTTELADAIYNPNEAHDPKVRKRVFQALKALATRGLASYCSVAPEVARIGSIENARRKVWHAARAGLVSPPKCPTCKRPL